MSFVFTKEGQRPKRKLRRLPNIPKHRSAKDNRMQTYFLKTLSTISFDITLPTKLSTPKKK